MSIFPIELCQHIKMNGDRCGAPALRDQKFCRFHNCCGPVEVDVSTSATVPAAPFLLPVLEDAASIQLAITQVCEHLLHRRLDSKQAGILLYAMQVASQNLSPLNGTSYLSKTQNGEPPAANPEASNSAAGSPASPDPLPPGTIQACAEQPPRRRRGRPRKAVPQLVKLNG